MSTTARTLPRPRRSLRSRRGFTYLETIVALGVAATFLSALYGAFMRMLRTTDRSTARLEAIRNGRTALATILDEVKSVGGTGSSFAPALIGINQNTANGDAKDNDRDGRVDEEAVNGRDDDTDWNALTDDTHAQLATVNPLYERYTFTQRLPFGGYYGFDSDDLGDQHVDEDVRFGNDILVFRVVPSIPVPDLLFRTVTYSRGSFDGFDNVLIRQSRTEFTAGSGRPVLVSTTPLAFGCLGLDFLYWDANGNPNPGSTRADRPYWTETWDSTDSANFDPPKLPLPATVYARLDMHADSGPLENYLPGRPVETISFQTAINIEQTIGAVDYPRPGI